MAQSKVSAEYVIDHLMLGASDLSLGKTWVMDQLGIRATDGGSHPGQGTRNALAGLTDHCYLEVIAPDPAQTLQGTLGEQLLGYSAPSLRTFAVRCAGFDDLVPRLTILGYQHRILEMSRETIDGIRLSWRLLFIAGHDYGDRMPFFIDWGQSPHPSLGLVAAGSLRQITVQLSADLAGYQRLMTMLDLPVVVTQGPPGLVASVHCEQGLVQL